MYIHGAAMFTYITNDSKPCRICGQPHSVTITEELFNATMVGLSQWLSGSLLIQDALPFLSIDDREILISGIGPKCWDKMVEEMDAAEAWDRYVEECDALLDEGK